MPYFWIAEYWNSTIPFSGTLQTDVFFFLFRLYKCITSCLVHCNLGDQKFRVKTFGICLEHVEHAAVLIRLEQVFIFSYSSKKMLVALLSLQCILVVWWHWCTHVHDMHIHNLSLILDWGWGREWPSHSLPSPPSRTKEISSSYRRLRARRALVLFKDVPLSTSRVLSL